ncbi:MAG TPA: glycosyltransferase family 4 protein, partial [Bacteroidia bacterium]|nr:glycosyltransferase family 4 protein [Bacteroidia bacterium]
MNKKPSLSFYTNIPTPYQLSFFDELNERFSLTVIYYSDTEAGREWKFDLAKQYKIILLKDNYIARQIQKKVFDFHFSWQIFKVAFTDKSDYVIVGGSYWIPDAVVALIFNKLKFKKIAYFSEPLFEVKSKIKYFVKWMFLRLVSINCKAVFCVGKKASESFESFGIHLPKFIIPYNINSKSFSEIDEKRRIEFKNKYKSNNEIVILSSGSLIERKGMDILIKAVKQIDDSNIRLIIIGDGPLRNDLTEMCNGDERIVFAGFQNPEVIPFFFSIADVFAFASRYDGWAVVINEAVAANVPIVCSDKVGAALELITSPDLGLICKSGDVDGFKQALQLLAKNEVLRAHMKEKAKELIPLISSDYNAGYVY